MAERGERRMVFDTRGRRRNVIRVVYAILALLMGASLFLVIGPFNLGELAGTGGASDASEVLTEQAERTEAKLRQQPGDEALLLSLTRTRLAAANASTEVNPETGTTTFTPEGRQQLLAAVETWDRYLAQAKEPNPSAAPLVASAHISLAETSIDFEELETNINGAVAAQRIAAEGRPTLNAFSSLAIYEYFDGNFAAGDAAAAKAAAKAPAKAEAKEVKKQLAEFRTRGKQLAAQKVEFAKQEGSQRKEALENPLGGLSGTFGE